MFYGGRCKWPFLASAPRAPPSQLRLAVDLSKLPEDFELAVVFGPSGSGKSSLLQDLVERYGLSATPTQAFE